MAASVHRYCSNLWPDVPVSERHASSAGVSGNFSSSGGGVAGGVTPGNKTHVPNRRWRAPVTGLESVGNLLSCEEIRVPASKRGEQVAQR